MNNILFVKNEARAEKSRDKQAAKSGKKLVITMDLQALLLCPHLLASALYNKTKLACHNITIHRIHDHDVLNYFWHEGEGGCTATFASCLQDFCNVEN